MNNSKGNAVAAKCMHEILKGAASGSAMPFAFLPARVSRHGWEKTGQPLSKRIVLSPFPEGSRFSARGSLTSDEIIAYRSKINGWRGGDARLHLTRPLDFT